jgi:hypothetical protein
MGKLTLVTDLPYTLNEVSAVQVVKNSNLIWLLNDHGNPHKIYGVDIKGKIKKAVVINAENNDWEDLATDELGNLYIGDFGNNHNNRKNLSILKVKNANLLNGKNADVERISFYFPEQHKFPPKKSQLYFDTESFFYFNNYFYLFTKSRVKEDYGKTSLYKIPAKTGNHAAEYISSFTFCNDSKCAITSATISANKKNIVLLNHDTVFILSNFIGDDFFSGNKTEISLEHKSQKEGVCFKNENTLYITDERTQGEGGNLYEIKINPIF